MLFHMEMLQMQQRCGLIGADATSHRIWANDMPQAGVMELVLEAGTPLNLTIATNKHHWEPMAHQCCPCTGLTLDRAMTKVLLTKSCTISSDLWIQWEIRSLTINESLCDLLRSAMISHDFVMNHA